MHLKRNALAAFVLAALVLPAAAQGSNHIHVRSPEQADATRAYITQYAYGQKHLPQTMPTVKVGVRTSAFRTARRIDRLTHRMPGGFVARMYLLHPRHANGRFLVFHSGHVAGVNHEVYAKPIAAFLARGYTVLAMSMPMTPPNTSPKTMWTHEQMVTMSRPLRPFLEPVTVGLNYTLAKRHYKTVSMAGLSGGGWTTAVYSAIDTRIQSSYPVAGSYPIDLRSRQDSSMGDFEQTHLPLYDHVSYEDMYVLASLGRRQLAIYNQFDNCCFAGTGYREFRTAVRGAVRSAGGGRYGVWLDQHSHLHQISPAAIDVIDRDIRR